MRKQMRHMAQSKLCLTTLDRSAEEVFRRASFSFLLAWAFIKFYIKKHMRMVDVTPRITYAQKLCKRFFHCSKFWAKKSVLHFEIGFANMLCWQTEFSFSS